MRPLLAIVGVILAGGIFFWYTKPTYDDVQVVQATIAQNNAALEKAAELSSLNLMLRSRFNSFKQSDKDRLSKLLPDHVDNVRLILDLDKLAGLHGLALQNVDVSSSQSQKQIPKSQTALGAIGASNQKYDSLTLTFSTVATYARFVEFLTELESGLRIVDLVSLSITPATGASAIVPSATNAFPTIKNAAVAKANEPLYAYNLTLRTYWLK